MVSIIILSYNTRDLLHACLSSLQEKLSHVPHEVIVLDNNSHDESSSMVKKAFPKCLVIQSPTNLGFAKGINKAVKKAKGEYLLFLNSDASLLDDNLKQMVSMMESDQMIAVVGGQLLNQDNSTSSSFDRFYLPLEVFRLLFVPRQKAETSQKQNVDWVSGGFMAIRKDIFEDLGGFDEHFFMYMEDMELCFRIHKKGFRVVYFPQAKARHVGQGSSNRSFAIINIFKGISYFYKKHRAWYEQIVVQLLLLIKSLTAYAVGIVTFNTSLRQTYRQAIADLL